MLRSIETETETNDERASEHAWMPVQHSMAGATKECSFQIDESVQCWRGKGAAHAFVDTPLTASMGRGGTAWAGEMHLYLSFSAGPIL